MSEFFFSGNPERPEISEFLCGVVEGFYGRPWTYSQRHELFKRMQSMGMNSYLYAPKDEAKHRMSWRQPYNEKENEKMKSLITAARDHNICFIFAISPGNDITFSIEADAKALQARLEQAVGFGCNAFALLFDDIDSRLSPPDQDAFGSPARAQAALTNKVYEALGRPEVFLFCPTEYCASRAVPNVKNSSYLTTLGTDLAEGINVMWTGPLVVSKNISTLSIRDLSRVLRRPIVLWDNLHANDYDPRRVYLGPYAGRPIALRRRRLLRGVLTNPNCEFEANYVAIHTLSQWAQIGHPTQTEKVAASSNLTDTSDDLEREEKEEEAQANEEVISGDVLGKGTLSTPPVYRPREALHNALRDWLALMLQDQRSTSVLVKQPSPRSSSPSPMDTDSTDNSETPMQIESDEVASTKAEFDCNIVPEFPASVVPSPGISLDDLHLLSDIYYLPHSYGPKALKILELGHWLRENAHLAPSNNLVERENNPWSKKYAELQEIISNVSELKKKLQQLPYPGFACDLAPYLTTINSIFTLLLDYFRWLESGVMVNKSQTHLKRLLTWYSPGYNEVAMSGDQEPWVFRGGLITELQRILPLESAQDLFPSPIQVAPTPTTTPAGQPIAVEAVGEEEEEEEELPSETQSLLENVNPTNVLTVFQSRRSYTLRLYRPEDKSKIYTLWRRILMHRLGLPQDALPEKYKDLPGDRYLLVYMTLFPEHGLVVEGPSLYFETLTSTSSKEPLSSNKEQRGIVGFAFAAPDLVSMTHFRDNLKKEVLRSKYPKELTLQQQQQQQDEENAQQEATPSKILVENFVKMTLDWIHKETITRDSSSAIPEATATEALPHERLSAAISEQQEQQQHKSQLQQHTMAISVENLESRESIVEDSEKPSDEKISLSSVEKDVNSSSNPGSDETEGSSGGQERVGGDEAEMLDCSTSSVITPASTNSTSVVSSSDSQKRSEDLSPVVGPARPADAIHSAMMAHPASIFVELDDSEFSGIPFATASPQSNNLGGVLVEGRDSPEMVLDDIARRLFICLLAGLKTCGSHGVHVELDAVNESRAVLYRHFNFYPVTAASTDFVTVLGRLI